VNRVVHENECESPGLADQVLRKVFLSAILVELRLLLR